MRILLTLLMAMTLNLSLGATPAYAQIDDILDDIFGKRGSQYPYPGNQFPGYSYIDNIPVNVDIIGTQPLDDHMLIISAYAPPAPNVRQAAPKLIGQTQILLNGLGDQLQMVVAAPESVTRDIPHARLEAKITDQSGLTVLRSRQDAYYSGNQPANLVLDRIGGSQPAPPSSSGVETVTGKARIESGQADLFRGGTLVVELYEDGSGGLAGGTGSQTVLGQTRVDIDQKTAPFDFTLDHVTQNTTSQGHVMLRAHIVDWAGRMVMETTTPVTYRGPGQNYDLMLRPFAGETVVSGPTPAPGPTTDISGEARFVADRGLPAGSKLVVNVLRAYGTPSQDRTLATRTIPLDGLSGYVKFDVVPNQTVFEPGQPDPLINVQVRDDRDRVFFDSGDQPLSTGYNIVELKPTSIY